MSLRNHRLSLPQIQSAYELIRAPFKHSPQYVVPGLSKHLGVELVAKIEALNPIRSFKARGAEILAARASSDEKIICASAGNFGQAVAYSCSARNIQCTIYASKHANKLKVKMMRAFGAQVILAGEDFDEAKVHAKAEAGRVGARFVEDGLDIETLEGAGSIGLELLELDRPLDVLLIPLGNGALASGIARVVKEKNPTTKVIVVQAQGASAMVASLRTQSYIENEAVNTICDGIAVRTPVKQSLIDLAPLIDDTLLVSDDTTIKAMQIIHQEMGLVCEPSGAVGISALLDDLSRFQGQRVGTILCGGNVTPQQMKMWQNV